MSLLFVPTTADLAITTPSPSPFPPHRRRSKKRTELRPVVLIGLALVILSIFVGATYFLGRSSNRSTPPSIPAPASIAKLNLFRRQATCRKSRTIARRRTSRCRRWTTMRRQAAAAVTGICDIMSNTAPEIETMVIRHLDGSRHPAGAGNLAGIPTASRRFGVTRQGRRSRYRKRPRLVWGGRQRSR